MNEIRLITLSPHELDILLQEAVTKGVMAALAEVQGQPVTHTQLLTRSQLAQAMQISPHQVGKLVKRGMPSMNCGADRRYRLSDVEEWMRHQAVH